MTLQKNLFTGLMLFVFGLPLVFAHGHEPTLLEQLPSPLLVLFYTALLTVFLLLYAVFKKKMREKTKQVVFWSIVVLVSVSTLYIVAHTFYYNIFSETNGPVHWHADFEIWICGEQQILPSSQFPSNKVGTPLLHHHNDYRMHIEGTVFSWNDVTLSAFFNAIGGTLGQTYIGIPQEDGSLKYWQNDDYCGKKQGTLHLYVQKGDAETWEEIEEIPSYIISPYADVPPGDRLKIMFE
ncbi:hypothetical protein HZC31_00080 [Candidatus Woesearchaeota archaeon]|nr:hypothetical protein [Candidatus Woesearchaeota archaeon]